jgi:hypothetical protein
MKSARSVSGLTLVCLIAVGPIARAQTGSTAPGKAAAHAALSDGAALPAAPPTLPAQASGSARNALSQKAFGKQGSESSAAEAQDQAARHAHDALLDAHVDAASHAAQGAVAAAARGANAEVRAAATQTQSNSAKANAAGHRGTHP